MVFGTGAIFVFGSAGKIFNDSRDPAATGGETRETHVSTFQTRSQAPSRLPRPSRDQERPQGARRPPQSWAQASVGLIPLRNGAPSSMQRMRKREEFVAARSGRKTHAATVTLQCRDRRDGLEPKAGFTVTKKTGGAVERNRIRRRLREALRRVEQDARLGHDYVLIGREGALTAPFTQMIDELTAAFGRVHSSRSRGDARRDVAPGDGSP